VTLNFRLYTCEDSVLVRIDRSHPRPDRGRRRYKQLVKTGSATADDLRQDAVMEQLFEVVNNLLQDNAETRMRQLGIRTYKVIPLTPRDGLLEWVEQTIPLATYLLGSNRAVRVPISPAHFNSGAVRMCLRLSAAV
jgi:hypothetical protein